MVRKMIGAASSSSIGRMFISSRMSRVRDLSSRSRRVVDMAAGDGELRVFLVAGEVSGDSIASRLMASLKKLSPFPVRFAGVGGALMYKEGLQSLFPMEYIAVMGIWELLPHLNKIRILLKDTIEAATLFRPHVVVTVDSKGFSFRFLNQLKVRFTRQEDSPVHVHYVAPSFWAWKGGESRLKGLCEFMDHILCILPFEEEICRLNGLAATYTGHPLLEDALRLNLDLNPSQNKLKSRENGDAFRRKHRLPLGALVITLLPGSRLQEVKRMLPIFLQTMELLNGWFSGLSAVIPVAPNYHVETYIKREIQTWPLPTILVSGASLDQKYDAFSGLIGFDSLPTRFFQNQILLESKSKSWKLLLGASAGIQIFAYILASAGISFWHWIQTSFCRILIPAESRIRSWRLKLKSEQTLSFFGNTNYMPSLFKQFSI